MNSDVSNPANKRRRGHAARPGSASPTAKRMPAPDNRLIEQLWDVHWSIVVQHVQCRKSEALK